MVDGTFTNVSEKAGIAKIRGNYGLGVLTGDFDNDGWPDIYVANDTNASLLFHNRHDGTFEEIGVPAGCAYDADGKEVSGMGVAAADFDGDGWLDIFKTNFSDEAASQAVKANYPLREARIDVSEHPGKPGVYRAVAFLRPHFQLDELSVSLRVVAELQIPVH